MENINKKHNGCYYSDGMLILFIRNNNLIFKNYSLSEIPDYVFLEADNMLKQRNSIIK